MKIQKGLSFYISFGKYAGFRAEYNKHLVRLVLGWVAISLLKIDVDCLLYDGVNAALQLKKKKRLELVEEFVESNEAFSEDSIKRQ